MIKLPKHVKITPRVGFFLRLKFAWKAFTLQDFRHNWPYQYDGQVLTGLECDNHRRISKCDNQAAVALADPFFEIKIHAANHSYFVCGECAAKYEGSIDGEPFRNS